MNSISRRQILILAAYACAASMSSSTPLLSRRRPRRDHELRWMGMTQFLILTRDGPKRLVPILICFRRCGVLVQISGPSG